MKKSILSILLVCTFLFSITGCSEPDPREAFIGSWTLVSGDTDNQTMILYSDGTCLVDGEENGTWSLVDGSVKILGSIGGMFWTHDSFVASSYSLDGNTLTLWIDGEDSPLIYEHS